MFRDRRQRAAAFLAAGLLLLAGSVRASAQERRNRIRVVAYAIDAEHERRQACQVRRVRQRLCSVRADEVEVQVERGQAAKMR